jgi:hypothetical protein
MAADSRGDVYAAYQPAGTYGPGGHVDELPAGGQQVTLSGYGTEQPAGLALDSSGDVFVADYSDNRVVEVRADGNGTVTVPFSGLSDPRSVAVDPAGDVFVAGYGDSGVLELPAGSAQQVTVPFTGLGSPIAVATDAAGDLFAHGSGNSGVLEMPAGSTQQVAIPLTGISGFQTMATDAAGDLYVLGAGTAAKVTEVSGYTAATTSVTAPATAVAGQPYTVDVKVAAANGALAPGGQVTVTDGGAQACTATLSPEAGTPGTATGSCQLTDTLGNYTLTADYAGNGAFAGSSATGGSIDVAPQLTADDTLPGASAGVPFTADLTPEGGIAPYTWSVADGSSLPAGLSLSPDGTLSGTPQAAGTYPFTIQVTDAGDPAQIATEQLTLQVSAPPVAVTTQALPGAVASIAYSQQLSADGGVAPYTWSLASGSLPAGLTLSANGIIAGTPKTTGTSTFTVQAADAENPAQTATKQLSITVVANKADLSVSVTGPASVKAGSTVSYTVTVTDRGPAPAAQLTAVLATAGLTGLTPGAGGVTKTVTIAGTTLTGSAWSVASLAAGQSVTFTVTGTAPVKTGVTAGATGGALASTPDPDLLNNLGIIVTKTTK